MKKPKYEIGDEVTVTITGKVVQVGLNWANDAYQYNIENQEGYALVVETEVSGVTHKETK